MTKKKILIVDDDSSVRWTLVSFLENKGYTVSEAQSGNEAYNYLETNSVDLVLSDIEMIDGTGLDLAKRLLTKTKRPPLILMSGSILIETMDVEEFGVSRFLAKPFDPATLLTTLEEALHSESA